MKKMLLATLLFIFLLTGCSSDYRQANHFKKLQCAYLTASFKQKPFDTAYQYFHLSEYYGHLKDSVNWIIIRRKLNRKYNLKIK